MVEPVVLLLASNGLWNGPGLWQEPEARPNAGGMALFLFLTRQLGKKNRVPGVLAYAVCDGQGRAGSGVLFASERGRIRSPTRGEAGLPGRPLGTACLHHERALRGGA